MIDKSEREPREKTAEKLGPLAAPVFEMLDGGGRSEKLEQLVEQLAQRGLADFVKIDLSIVRGLAYYTGVVFEVFDRAGEAARDRRRRALRQIDRAAERRRGLLAGDRFRHGRRRPRRADQEHAGGRGAQIARSAGSASALDLYLVIAKEERRADALRQLQKLRDAGWRVDYPIAPTKVGKQFQTAESLGAKATVLYGDEWPQVKLKTLATRAETLVPHEKIASYLQARAGELRGS